jgi:hypothetical protein
MGQRYRAIESFMRQGPAWLSINVSDGVQAEFLVEAISPPSPAPAQAPFSSFLLAGPCGRICLDEEEIAHVQPDGPQEGTSLYISLDNGASLTLARQRLSP